VYPTGVTGTSALASVGIIGVNVIAVTTDALTSGLGSLTVVGHSNVALTGVYGTGAITSVLVWGVIVPGQDPEWAVISDSQSPSWGDVDEAQDPEWTDIAA